MDDESKGERERGERGVCNWLEGRGRGGREEKEEISMCYELKWRTMKGQSRKQITLEWKDEEDE